MRSLKPNINVQSDSIRAKVFLWSHDYSETTDFIVRFYSFYLIILTLEVGRLLHGYFKKTLTFRNTTCVRPRSLGKRV